MIVYVHLCLAIFVSFCETVNSDESIKLDKQYVSSTANLLRARGYLAEDYFVPVQDGAAILNLVRAKNPLINDGLEGLPDKDPVLFLHGMGSTGNVFILNKDAVEPKDYSSYDVQSTNLSELQKLLKDEPASRSLVFTALNFGHEVWLLNRRQTLESQYAYLFHHGYGDQFHNFNEKKMTAELEKNLQNSGYWNFSVDDQIAHDIPEIINYILKYTKRDKLAYVGHSAGSVILLGTFIVKPEIAEKVSKAILWAPAIYGRIHSPIEVQLFNAIIPWLAKTAIPLTLASLIHPLESLIGSICNSQFLRLFICNPIADLISGPGSIQQLRNFKEENEFLGSTSSREAAQALRIFTRGQFYPLEQVEESKNPGGFIDQHLFYNVSKIKSKTISLWAGNSDSLIPFETMDRLISDMKVPVERHAIGGDNGISFSHLSFEDHEQISNLLIIPSLKTLESE